MYASIACASSGLGLETASEYREGRTVVLPAPVKGGFDEA